MKTLDNPPANYSYYCDKCKLPIGLEGEKMITLGEWCVHLHMECLTKSSAVEMLKILDIDETLVTKFWAIGQLEEESLRVRDARNIGHDGEVAGPQEIVTWQI